MCWLLFEIVGDGKWFLTCCIYLETESNISCFVQKQAVTLVTNIQIAGTFLWILLAHRLFAHRLSTNLILTEIMLSCSCLKTEIGHLPNWNWIATKKRPLSPKAFIDLLKDQIIVSQIDCCSSVPSSHFNYHCTKCCSVVNTVPKGVVICVPKREARKEILSNGTWKINGRLFRCVILSHCVMLVKEEKQTLIRHLQMSKQLWLDD